MNSLFSNTEIKASFFNNDVKVLELVKNNLGLYAPQFKELNITDECIDILFNMNREQSVSLKYMLDIYTPYVQDFSKIFALLLETRNKDFVNLTINFIKDNQLPYSWYKGEYKEFYEEIISGPLISSAFKGVLKYSFNHLAWILNEMDESYTKKESKEILERIVANRMGMGNIATLKIELNKIVSNLSDFKSPIGKLVMCLKESDINGGGASITLNGKNYDDLWLRMIEIEELNKVLPTSNKNKSVNIKL